MGSSSIISLSIEETNIIRASFGLKPIPIPNNKNERKHFNNNNNNNNNNNKFNVDYLNAYEKKNDHIDGTIRDNSLTTESVKVNSNKTSKFMHLHDHTDIDTKYTNILETNINNTNEKSDDGDWLSNIKKVVPKMRVKQQKTTLEDNERVISTNNKDIKKIITNKLILTLQETNVLDNDKDADDDKLVSNDAFDFISDAKAAGDDAHKKGFAFFTSTRTSTAINRDSQHGKPQEAVISNSTAVASTGTKKDGNKIRVLFDSDEGDSNDATNRIDYAEIKIKKRQKKKKNSFKRVKISTSIPILNHKNNDNDDIIDEDPETIEMNNILSTIKRRPNNDIMDQNEKSFVAGNDYYGDDKKYRELQLKKNNTGFIDSKNNILNKGALVLDQNTMFFDSLSKRENKQVLTDTHETPDGKLVGESPDFKNALESNYPTSKVTAEMAKKKAGNTDTVPDLYNGVASTLKFLNDFKIPKNPVADSATNYDVVYKDKQGNLLSPKEAYRQFSKNYDDNRSRKKKIKKTK